MEYNHSRFDHSPNPEAQASGKKEDNSQKGCGKEIYD
jgi:hypothetical protein